MVRDIKIVETLNGGDAQLSGKDLALVEGFGNMPYIGMFGGNVKQSTGKRLETEQAFDWWGNLLLMGNTPDMQFNSETERTLMSVALNSQGRVLIEAAVKRDMAFMEDFAQVSVVVEIIANDKVQITIRLQEPDNLQEREFIYIWDGTLRDLRETPVILRAPAVLYPVNIVAPVISGSTGVGDVLTTTNGSWNNSPTSYLYQWYRDGNAIALATANTYTLTIYDYNENITCRVTAVNADGTGAAFSNVIPIPPPAAPTQDIEIMGLWGSGETDMDTLTITSFTAGTYTSISDDGGSGSITLSINGGAYAAFSSPLVLVATDTIDVKRTVSTGDGYFILTGTY
jgi:hypothetical protein